MKTDDLIILAICRVGPMDIVPKSRRGHVARRPRVRPTECTQAEEVMFSHFDHCTYQDRVLFLYSRDVEKRVPSAVVISFFR